MLSADDKLDTLRLLLDLLFLTKLQVTMLIAIIDYYNDLIYHSIIESNQHIALD